MPAPEGSISDIIGKLRPRSWSHVFHVVEALALILAIAAIYYEGRHANELLKTVEGLAANMSTQYVAEFPYSLGPISDDVDKVCGTIDAMVDVAGYGFYSEPGGFDKYYESIAKSANKDLRQRLEMADCANAKTDLAKELKLGQSGELKNPRVRMILFSPDDRILSVHQQLKDLGRPSGMNPDEVKVLRAFAQKNKSLISPSEANQMVKAMNTPAGYHDFRVLLQEQLCEIEKNLRSNEVEVRYAKDQFITRWWLVDRKRAVFSFDHKAITESTFKSSDYQMLKNFNGIFDSWWSDSVRYSDYWDVKKKDHGASVADMPSGGDQDDPIDDVKDGLQSCKDIVPDLVSSDEKKGK